MKLRKIRPKDHNKGKMVADKILKALHLKKKKITEVERCKLLLKEN